MIPRILEKGDILQITNCNNPDFIGFLLAVSEPQDGGALGYIFLPYNIDNLTRYKGLAYLFVKFEDVEYIGRSILLLETKADA